MEIWRSCEHSLVVSTATTGSFQSSNRTVRASPTAGSARFLMPHSLGEVAADVRHAFIGDRLSSASWTTVTASASMALASFVISEIALASLDRTSERSIVRGVIFGLSGLEHPSNGGRSGGRIERRPPQSPARGGDARVLTRHVRTLGPAELMATRCDARNSVPPGSPPRLQASSAIRSDPTLDTQRIKTGRQKAK